MNLEENPWKIKIKNVVYENNWIKVNHHEVVNPSGGEGIYGTVEFKNVAIGIIPIDDENNTWLVGQYRFPIEEYSWEIPEGGCPEGEDWLAAAQRELKEETGLVAQKWKNIARVHTSNSVCKETGYIFVAENLTLAESEPEETEKLVIRKIPLSEAVNMAMNNEITDSLSVIGLLKVAKIKGII